MICFENFFNKKTDIIKPSSRSKKHTQALNRNTIDRKKGLYFVPHSDRIKRINDIVRRFEVNKNLKYLPISPEKAQKLAEDYDLTVLNDTKDFIKSLKRTDLILIKRGTKYIVMRKKKKK